MITTNHTNDSVRVNQLYIVSALIQNKHNCLTIHNGIVLVDKMHPTKKISLAHAHFYFDDQGLLEKTEEYEEHEIQAFNEWVNNCYPSQDDNESEDFEE